MRRGLRVLKSIQQWFHPPPPRQAAFDASGKVTIAFFALESFAPGKANVLNLLGTVPEDAPYGSAQTFQIGQLEVNAGLMQATADAGLHVVAYPGDANANRRYDAEDARLIARVGNYWASVEAGIPPKYDSGFAVNDPDPGDAWTNIAYPAIDAMIIGDVTGNGDLSVLDASDLLRRVVGLATPNIPPCPRNKRPRISPSLRPAWPRTLWRAPSWGPLPHPIRTWATRTPTASSPARGAMTMPPSLSTAPC